MTDSPHDDLEHDTGPDDATVQALRAMLRADDQPIDPARREQSIQAALLASRELHGRSDLSSVDPADPAAPSNDERPLTAPVPIASRRVSRRAAQVLAAAAAVVVVVTGAFVLTGREGGVATSQEDASLASGADASKEAGSASDGAAFDSAAPTIPPDQESSGAASGVPPDGVSTTTMAPRESATSDAFAGLPTAALLPLGAFDDTAALLLRAVAVTDGLTTESPTPADPDRTPNACTAALDALAATPVATATVAGTPVLVARTSDSTPVRTLVLAAPDCIVLASS